MTLTGPSSTPASAEILYEQGMAHYQRRQWQQALEYFKQVQEVDPTWPGLDSLIDEASWFLQLENVDARSDLPPVQETRDTSRSRPMGRWLLPLAVGVALVGLLAWWQGWIPGIGTRIERETLRNRGQASLAAGDYQGAIESFSELARLQPGDPAATEGLERAARLERLVRDFQEAEAAIAAEEWNVAEAKLQAVLAVDATYDDAAGRLALVRRQRDASELFRSGIAAYDSGERTAAIASLERLSESDPQYQREAVREILFVLYIQDGQAILATRTASAARVRQAAGRFGQALALHPHNVQAMDESRLVNQYLEAIKALDRQDLSQAETLLSAILQERPRYADGQAAAAYYDLLVRKGDVARAQGEIDLAAESYRLALGWAPSDSSAALAGLTAVQAAWTPTPEPTALPTPFVESQTDTLNIRIGPGTDYPVIGQVVAGARLALVGRNAAGDWLVVCCVEEKPGWVAARLVRTDASIADLPVGLPVQRPPTATPVATPRPPSSSTPTPLVPVPTPTVDTDTGSTPEPPPQPPTPTSEPPTPTPEAPTPTPEPPTPTPEPPTPTPEPR